MAAPDPIAVERQMYLDMLGWAIDDPNYSMGDLRNMTAGGANVHRAVVAGNSVDLGSPLVITDNGDGTVTLNAPSVGTTTTTTTAATTTTTTTAATTTTTTTAATGLSSDILALNPLGYWKLNEISGTVATDYSGNARHGAYSGSVTLNIAGSGFPDFTGGYVEIPDADVFSLGTSPGLSVFALVRLTSLGPAPRYIVRKGNISGNFEYAFLRATTAETQASVWNTTGTPINFRIGAINLTTVWTAAVATIADGVSVGGTGIALYVDNNTPTSSSAGGSGSGYVNGTAPLRIGEAWRGSLGHVAVFPGVLTAAQVNTLISSARTEGLIP